MSPSDKGASFEDVLYEFSIAKPIPDAELLNDFVQRYPEHAAALVEFAVELALEARMPTPPATSDAEEFAISPSVSRVISKFHNALFAARQAQTLERQQASPTLDPPANPFTALDRTQFRRLSNELNANLPFVCKLRDRQIDPTTMSDGFVRHVADCLEVPVGVLTAHFAAPPAITVGQRFSSENKPVVGERQAFVSAVRTSGLTLEQQAFLLSL